MKIFRHDQYHRFKVLDKQLTTQVFKKKSLTLLPEKHPALLNAHSRFEELNSAYVEVQNSHIPPQMPLVRSLKSLTPPKFRSENWPYCPNCHILKKAQHITAVTRRNEYFADTMQN